MNPFRFMIVGQAVSSGGSFHVKGLKNGMGIVSGYGWRGNIKMFPISIASQEIRLLLRDYIVLLGRKSSALSTSIIRTFSGIFSIGHRLTFKTGSRLSLVHIAKNVYKLREQSNPFLSLVWIKTHGKVVRM